MKRYIHLFANKSEYDQERYGNYYEPWLSYTKIIERVDYNKTEEEKLLSMPFTIEALGSGNITWYLLDDKTVQYAKNGGAWETMDGESDISVVEGDEVQFKGTNTDYSGNKISTTMQFNVKGNIMSLTDGDNFKSATTVNDYTFGEMFQGNGHLVSASGLKLPATTLASNCYGNMFEGCTSLTTAPEELPATTLANSCYAYMFQGCTSLTKAPKLPATTLANNCYQYMFNGCTSLTTAPELPATALTGYCYAYMFQGCTSLTTAPVLPAKTLKSNCYNYMFSGCTSLNYIKAMFTTTPSSSYTNNWVNGVASTGTFVKNTSASWTTTGNHGVPTGWTIETAST